MTIANLPESKSAKASPAFAFDVTEGDARLFEQHLRSFVPPDTFDVHTHLYRVDQQGDTVLDFVEAGPQVIGLEEFRELPRTWMGDRAPTDGLFFTLPRATMDVRGSNQFIIDETAAAADSRWLLLVRPGDDPAEAERQARLPQCAGFKVYHVFATPVPKSTFFAEPETFVPEWVWELAHRHSQAIMLHIVKPRALADEQNQRYIREHCIRYPNAKLILAHAARGFNGRHTVEGIGAIRGLDNVFFDTSAICESEPIEAILKAFGPSRLMYGGDFPFTEIAGRNLAMGDGFFWLLKGNADYDEQKINHNRTLVGIESLLAIRQACMNLGLTDSDVEKMFCTTARELLGITSRAGRRTGQALYEHAKTIIPGGAQLLGKRSEMFAPGQWPAYFAEARGCETIDLDGQKYIDMSMCGIGATLLGYADPDVNAAVTRRLNMGVMCTLNPPDEVELAELLLKIHPWAQMARFGRMGGETMAMAIRIARARTRRDHVAFCGYHGWHDWYLAANVSGASSDGDALGGYHLMNGLPPTGVPRGLADTLHPFDFNDLDALKQIVATHGRNLAAIVLEPARSHHPVPGFLAGVRELATRCNARLIFDEVSIGWRLCLGGSHLKYGVDPDIAVFAKTLGNGHPMAAVIGTADTMSAAQDTFMSSAFWTEAVGPAAAVATVKKMMRIDVPAYVARIGQRARDGLTRLATAQNLPLVITGFPSINYFHFEHPQTSALQTLWTVRMLERGFLASGHFYPTLAHEDRHIDAYLDVCDRAFADMSAGLERNDVESRIGGPVKHAGFRRLN